MTFPSIVRWRRLALGLVLCLSLLPGQAMAIDPIEIQAETSLTLHFSPDGQAAQGTEFRIYQVASAGQFAEFTPVEAFRGYPVKMNGLTAGEWADLAATLTGYVARDEIQPTASATVTAQGTVSFSGLTTGLHLVVGDSVQRGNTVYTPTAVMISLPSRNQDDQWVYHVEAQVKHEEEDVPAAGDQTSVHVQKVWQDSEEDVEFRPETVAIQLLKDGEVYDTVYLTAAGNWRHTWTELPAGHQWTVVEDDVVDGYTVRVSRDDASTYVVTNTAEDLEIPTVTPPLVDVPEVIVPEVPGGEPSGRLPQTGVLWWPVPVLAVGGMGCYLAGWLMDRKEQDDER